MCLSNSQHRLLWRLVAALSVLGTACTATLEVPAQEDLIDEGSTLSGQDMVVARRVVGLNDQHPGRFGTWELTGGDDGNTGAFRAQLSPDGTVMVRMGPSGVWEVLPARHLSKAVTLGAAGEITKVTLDDTLGPRATLVAASAATGFIDDNLEHPEVKVGYGGNQLAIGFNPLFASRGIPTAVPGSCQIDSPPLFSPRDDTRYDCLHLLVYARGFEATTCPKTAFGGQMCIMLAPLVVVLDRGTSPANNPAPALERAHLGKFRPIRMNGEGVRNSVNELAASADGSLIFYVDVDLDASGAKTADDGVDIAYTYNPRPYVPLSQDPAWASTGWSSGASLWHLYDHALVDTSTVRGIPGGFRRAYPMAQYPFRFANGVRLREGLGRYQWFSPEGSEMFVNVGSRAVAGSLGRETRGVLRHVDSPAQLTNAVYCSVCSPDLPYTGPQNAPVCAQGCDPLLGLKGNPACSHDSRCSNNGLPRFGVQEYTSFGTASGVWTAPERPGAQPTLPFLRRSPLRYMAFNNKALRFFSQDTANRGTQMWLLQEVDESDFDDPNYVGYFHMNEAIFGSKRCTFGTDTACDIEVDEPFLAPGTTVRFTGDTSRGAVLGNLQGGAMFPYDYWRSQNVGERVQGNAEGTGEVNPGYRGRAIRFPPQGFVEVTTDTAGRLSAPKTALTVELAVRPETTSATYTGVLVEQPGVFRLDLAAGRLRLTTAKGSVTATGTTTLSANAYTHVAAVLASENAGTLTATLYVNGAALATSSATLALGSLPAATGARRLCIGPGCDAASSVAMWLDEVAVSNIARSNAYLANAANQTFSVAGFSAMSSTAMWPTLLGTSVDWTGLDRGQLRVPSAVLNAIGGDSVRFQVIAGLGRALFHDPVLSTTTTGNNGVACSSCHAERTAFTSPTHQPRDPSLAGGSLALNSPTIINRAMSIRQFLDTRSTSVVEQAAGPISNPNEMGGSMTAILGRLNSGIKPGAGGYLEVSGAVPTLPVGVTNYRQWFCLAFTGKAACADLVSDQRIKLALATYELAQIRGGSQVDQMRAGLAYTDTVASSGFTMSLARGYAVFSGKGRCGGCHKGATYTDELRHSTGPLGPAGQPVSVKTPTLRALAKTYPYFHDGSNGLSITPTFCPFTDPAGLGLCQVVEFYNRGACRHRDTITLGAADSAAGSVVQRTAIVDDVSCDPESVSLGLSDAEARDLVAFLRAL